MAVLSVEPSAPASARRELPPSMVERMTLIMDAFTGRHTRLTLEEVARATRLPRSTAHRILEQLVRLDWLDHTSSGYRLGKRTLAFGDRDTGHGQIREAAAPLLHTLHLRTGMVVQLAVLEGAEIFYLDKIGGRFALAVPSRVGGRAPAHSTALGKAILAWLDPEQVEAATGASVRRVTSPVIADIGVLHSELRRIRQRRGLAFERGESFEGIYCVAAAVHGPDGPVAGISLAGDARAPLERVAPLVAAAARQVSVSLVPGAAPRRPLRAVPVAAPAWSRRAGDRPLAAGQSARRR